MTTASTRHRASAWWALSGVGALALAGAASLSGCATMGTNAEKVAAEQLISIDEENKLGAEVKTELETKQNVRYITDPTVVGYVTGVADKVIAFGKKDRPEVNWQVHVIDDPKTVNAFATPGGYLYVYSGLLLAADNEAELAGVMAHETGHVVARHSARSMVTQYGLNAVTAMVLGENPGLLGQIAAGIATKGVLLKHSRGEETEADEYGARYSAAAGYDPHGLVTFFQKLEAKEGATPAVLSYLSDHPATPDRVQHVDQYIAQHGLTGAELGRERFAPIKAKIAAGVASAPASTAKPAATAPAAAPPPPPPPSP